MVKVCESEGRYRGPAFTTPDGKLAVPGDYDAVFWEYMTEVQAETELISNDVDVDAWFNLNRTPRRSTITRMKRAGLGKDAEEMGRWKTVENAKGRRPRFNMRHLYSEACLLMPVTWLCSYFLWGGGIGQLGWGLRKFPIRSQPGEWCQGFSRGGLLNLRSEKHSLLRSRHGISQTEDKQDG